MTFGDVHIYETKVQFEDLDMGGVVHHPNYLKFYERARVAAMESTPYSHAQMWDAGIAMAVAEAYLNYRKPLRIYQDLFICTKVVGILKSNFRVVQAICSLRPSQDALKQVGEDFSKLPELCHFAALRLVCIDVKAMKSSTPPEALLGAFGVSPGQVLPESARQVRILT